MMKEFNSPDEFTSFLRSNETIRSILPFAAELVSLTDSIDKGCACRKNQRIANRDHVYRTMLKNILAVNKELQDMVKQYGGFQKALWKLNNETVLEI